MKVFLDANSYLSFFGENSDIGSLEALIRLSKEKRVGIFATEQVENEYTRNVGDRIGQTIRAIDGRKLDLKQNFKPAEAEDKDLKKQEQELREKVEKGIEEIKKAFEEHQKERLEQYKKRIVGVEELVEEVFGLAEVVPYSSEIVESAKLRHLKGNPPIKKDSQKLDSPMGDAISWESILTNAADDDLAIISTDPDYSEDSGEGRKLNRFLKKEWESKTKKDIILYLGLGRFVNEFENKEVISDAIVRKEESTPPYVDFGLINRPWAVVSPGAPGVIANAEWLNPISDTVTRLTSDWIHLNDSILGRSFYTPNLNISSINLPAITIPSIQGVRGYEYIPHTPTTSGQEKEIKKEEKQKEPPNKTEEPKKEGD